MIPFYDQYYTEIKVLVRYLVILFYNHCLSAKIIILTIFLVDFNFFSRNDYQKKFSKNR